MLPHKNVTKVHPLTSLSFSFSLWFYTYCLGWGRVSETKSRFDLTTSSLDSASQTVCRSPRVLGWLAPPRFTGLPGSPSVHLGDSTLLPVNSETASCPRGAPPVLSSVSAQCSPDCFFLAPPCACLHHNTSPVLLRLFLSTSWMAPLPA